VIVGVGVGIAAMYVWGWGRFRRVRAYWRYQQQSAHLERILRDARDDATSPVAPRLASDDDRQLIALLEPAKADQAALESCGFTKVADAVIAVAQGLCVVRQLVDASGSTSARIFARARSTAVILCSSTQDQMFSTTRGGRFLTDPPFVHRQTLAADLSHGELVRRHRAFAKLDEVGRTFDRVTTAKDVLEQLASSRTRVAEWRAAQPPDELLDADLREILGEQYGKLGKIWARRLRDELPRATVRQ
jgi:hypothetical protein